MKRIIGIIICSTLCFAFSADVQRKVIRDNGFDIECYVALEKQTNFNKNKTYYWFKSGQIHQSMSTSGGLVLHKEYSKYYKSKQLAEQGTFSFGLKIGDWKTWHTNGKLKTHGAWVNGYKNGRFKAYDSLGNLMVKGDYKNNLKAGYWIDFTKKDTTYHKNNFEFKERPKNLVERILRKRDSLEKIQIKVDRLTKRKNDSINRVKLKLKRLNKKRSDSIKRRQAKLKRLEQKKMDSINKSKGKPSSKKNFFNKLFKAKNK
ncbi:toxin-antitoxin system YwqK family antitoxin [Flavivirga spongiicola]|uniref:MORN repeat protein n=1 Tax=Flavivirga spongiicola TaxID=421621 RepID=A0ABU7XNA8_9FLAO|nr:hypothetical protein [Flavivirga sp. MEBiC05379]MDO5981456.1 hypothetical protein [Flavivirga sp. MEBiC05379]MDO5981897.1 hypothetical protein [Flavivirga sp. MEBiC05379]